MLLLREKSSMDMEQQQKVLAIREVLIGGHRRYLDGGGNPDVAICRQKDIASVFEKAIMKLDELLKETGAVFQ
jgi:hypothetical protein